MTINNNCRFVPVTLSIIISLLFISPSNGAMEIPNDVKFRLPDGIIPLRYDITLTPNLHDKTYFAQVNIAVKAKKKTNIIVLNGLNFTFEKIVVRKLFPNQNAILVDASKGETSKWEENKEKQQIKIKLSKSVEPGINYEIKMKITNKLSMEPFGFYYHEYEDGGKNWSMAATKFEHYGARLAFPCFDEPAMRAIFRLKVIRPKHLVAYFNTPKIKTTRVINERDLEEDEFAATKAMSTYLLMIAITTNNYVVKESDRKYRDKIILRGIAPQGVVDKLSYSLQILHQGLEHFEKIFKIDFPGNSLDVMSITGYHEGAMETWGLMPFDPALLHYTDSDPDFQRILVNMVTTHELVHHWLGNYVTMKWWNDIWIKEGLASYFHKDCLEEEAKDGENFDDLTVAMNRDSQFDSHPVSLPQTFNDAPSQEHAIVYKKASSILKMTEIVLGKETFYQGLRKFLHEHKYGSANTADFWKSMFTYLINLMDPWLKQKNFPLVHIKLNRDGKSFTARQEHFYLDKIKNDGRVDKYPTRFKYLWKIPLKFKTSKNDKVEGLVWLKEKEQTFPFSHNDGPASWIKLNHNHYGFYITNYDNATWYQILQNANNKKFTKIDLGGILLDLQFLLKSGQINIAIVLDFLSVLATNREPPVWKIGQLIIQDIYDHVYFHPDQLKLFKKHIGKIVSDTMKQTRPFWNHEIMKLKHYEGQMHTAIFQSAVLVDEPDTIAYLLREFQNVMKGKNLSELDETIAPYVLPYGLAKGGSDNWETLFARYKKEANNSDLLKALGNIDTACFRIDKILAYLTNNQFAIATVLTTIANQGIPQCNAWRYLIYFSPSWSKNFNNVENIEESAEFLYLKALAKTFDSAKDLEKVEKFFKENVLGKAMQKQKEEILEIISKNVKWNQNHFNNLKNYYANKYPRV